MNGEVMLNKADYSSLADFFSSRNIQRIFLVADSSYDVLPTKEQIERLAQENALQTVHFCDFLPNPDWSSIISGVTLFRKSECQAILANGGGSAIDVAKCIKLYANSSSLERPLPQPSQVPSIILSAIPTTAGTGSEATRFAVVYFEGVKQSITDDLIIPDFVLFDAQNLLTLPLYQKKATMMDALCHGVESMWSVNSTPESLDFSKTAISEILRNKDGYLANRVDACIGMLRAANIAGKAINITQTTAGHAMSYKLSTLCKIAHGHAAALCVSALWSYMLTHMEDCIDVRGKQYLEERFAQLAELFHSHNAVTGAQYFSQIIDELGLSLVKSPKTEILDSLVNSVNPDRLKNNPVRLSYEAIKCLYVEILGGNNEG